MLIPPPSFAGQVLTGVLKFNPLGKNFNQRLDAWIADVRMRHLITIRKTAGMRDPAKAQVWHIAHMFVYNAFKGRKPAKSEKGPNGHEVIQWEHISDAKVQWQYGVKWQDFLRDATGKVPVKTPDGKDWTVKPDKAKSREQAYRVLESAKIATSDKKEPHGAMVAPGYNGCGEPCKCGGHASKHTAGMACDINRQDLEALERVLRQKNAGTVDAYLREFGLHRPMMLGQKNDEPWHIEATKP